MTRKDQQVQELYKAEAAFQVASQQYEAARNYRNDMIRRALREGWTHAEISRVTGLSRGRISQL